MKNLLTAAIAALTLNAAHACRIESDPAITRYKVQLSTGGSMSYLEKNPTSPETIIFVHGNSASGRVFAKQLQDPRFDQRLIAVDLLGHGDSTDAQYPIESYKFSGYAQAINELMTILEIKNAIVCGWSFGGHVAIDMMWLNPQFVKGILITGTPPIDLKPEGFMAGFNPFEGLELMSQSTHFTRDQAEKFISMAGIRPEDYPGLVEDVMRTHVLARQLMIENATSGRELSQKEMVNEMSHPIAIVHGAFDQGINGNYIQSIPYQNLWGFRELPTGHAAFAQAPQEFNTILINFAMDVFVKQIYDAWSPLINPAIYKP